MSTINKLARRLFLKYAGTELFNPNAKPLDQSSLIKKNLISLYENFMLDLNGAIALVEGAYSLPFIKGLHDIFAIFISEIRAKDLVDLNEELNKCHKAINAARVDLNNFIKTNTQNQLFTSHQKRKTLASTVERILVQFQKQLKDQQLAAKETTKMHLPIGRIDERRTMDQTLNKLQRLLLTYGEYYGLSADADERRDQVGKINHKDALLAKELVSALMGLDKLTDKSEHALKRHVDRNLVSRIMETLNPSELDVPIGGGHAKPAPFRRGTRFLHPKFGEGMLISQDGDGPEAKLTIKFESGSKTLLAKYVTEVTENKG